MDMEVPDWGWGPWSHFLCVPLMTISLSFQFHKNLSSLKVSRTLLKNDDTLLEFRTTGRFLTGAGDHDQAQVSSFITNPSCLKVSRTLLKNYDTLLEFRRMWWFLTGAGSMITFMRNDEISRGLGIGSDGE